MLLDQQILELESLISKIHYHLKIFQLDKQKSYLQCKLC